MVDNNEIKHYEVNNFYLKMCFVLPKNDSGKPIKGGPQGKANNGTMHWLHPLCVLFNTKKYSKVPIPFTIPFHIHIRSIFASRQILARLRESQEIHHIFPYRRLPTLFLLQNCSHTTLGQMKEGGV